MRTALKAVARVLADLAVSPLWLAVRLTRSDALFLALGQALALAPGATGSFLRVAYLRRTLDNASDDCHVGFGTYFSKRRATIGRGAYIGAYCILGMADIGDHATIASRVSVLSGKRQHAFADPDVPIQEQGGEFTRVRVGRNCWVGEGSVVMADLGDNCVVGAGSVVNRTQPGLMVVAGNPARAVRPVGEAA